MGLSGECIVWLRTKLHGITHSEFAVIFYSTKLDTKQRTRTLTIIHKTDDKTF